jgi:hypothetical protein
MDVLNFQKPAAYRNTHASEMMEHNYGVESMTVQFDEIDLADDMEESEESSGSAEDNQQCTLL